MKKTLVLLATVVMIGLSTGCKKEKVLDCSTTQEQSGIEMKQNMKATFKGNEVTDVKVTVDAVLGETYKNYKSLFVSSIESSFKKYEDLKGVDIKTTDKDDVVTVTLKADITKMDDEAKDALDIVDTTGNYEATKKALEKEGYTCK
ncbi:MAG: hypothetical protein E7157_04840 [Lactobacillales bacterium]|nr:hypothetical protein [Lactobacillales bacterium]